jgi:hypothetical protein
MSAAIIDLVRVRLITAIAHVRADLIERERAFGPRAAKVYVARQTKFWHHDERGVRRRAPIALHELQAGERALFRLAGPRGEHIDIVEDWRGFLDAAEAKPDLFGPEGFAAFMAAHGDNCVHPIANLPWSARDWSAYAAALRRFQRRATLRDISQGLPA